MQPGQDQDAWMGAETTAAWGIDPNKSWFLSTQFKVIVECFTARATCTSRPEGSGAKSEFLSALGPSHAFSKRATSLDGGTYIPQ